LCELAHYQVVTFHVPGAVLQAGLMALPKLDISVKIGGSVYIRWIR